MNGKTGIIAVIAIFLLAGIARADWVTDTIQAGLNPCAAAVNPVTGTAYIANFSSNSVTLINCVTSSPMVTIPVDSNPCAVAVNPITNKIYVANQAGNSITVIDGASNRTTRIAAGAGPCAIAINGATNSIYVANKTGNTITRVSGSTNDTQAIGVGIAPCAIAVNPVTNKIYVADSGSSTMTEIDGVTNETASIVVGSGPRAVCVNPVTNKIYVANQLGNSVSIIDGMTRAAVTVTVGKGPASIAANPATNTVYVANQLGNSITVIDGVTNGTSGLVAGSNPVSVAVNLVTDKIYVANYLGTSVTVINGATKAAKTVTVQGGPVAVAVNTAMNRIYVANRGSANVSVIDGASIDTVEVAIKKRPYGVPAINPITNKIYVTTEDGVTEIDGETNMAEPFYYSDSVSNVAVNPLTNKVYVAISNGSVVIIDLTTGSRTPLNVEDGLFMVSPEALAVNTVTNKIYVTDGSGKFPCVIDGATETWKRLFTRGGQADAIAVNPVTNKVYIANWGSVSVIDGASNVPTELSVYSEGSSIAVNPLTNKIYVPMYRSSYVAVIDGETETWTTIRTDSIACAVAVNPMTNKIYVGSRQGKNLTVIDGATNTATAIPLGADQMNGIAVNPVTNKVYVVCSSRSAVYVIDGATNKVTPVWTSAFDGGIAVNPVTGTIYKPDAYVVGSSKHVLVMTETPASDTKLLTRVDIPVDHFTYSARPVISGKAVNRLRPGHTGLYGVGARIGTLQQPWSWSALTSGAGTDSVQWTFTWGSDSLVMGENYLCAMAVDSQVATTNNLGPGTSYVGNLMVFPVYRLRTPPLSAPTLLAPADSTIDAAIPVTFSWSSVSNADYYILQLSKYADFIPASYSQRINGTSQLIRLEGGNTYFWRVNAANNGGASAWSQSRRYSIVAVSAPHIVSPSWAAQQQPTSLALVWNSVKSAATYHVEVTASIQYSTSWNPATPLVVQDSLVTDTFKLVKGLLADTTYCWRIRAKNAGTIISGWTEGLFFTISTRNVPVLIAPADGDTGAAIPLTLVWSKINTAVGYHVQVATDTGFTGIFLQDSLLADTTKTIAPANATTYYWRVRAKGAGGFNPWSAPNSFKTRSTAMVLSRPSLPRVFSLTESSKMIRYSLPLLCRVCMQLYDLRGRIVATPVNATQAPGYYTVPITDIHLSQGAYITGFKAGNFIKRKLILIP
jgi:YVTN family beta-propeller protein